MLLARSCSQIQEEASCALEDGASGDDLDVLAGCGKDGKFGSNIQRDMQTRLLRHLKVPLRPYRVAVPALEKTSGLVRVTEPWVVLPHDLWKALSRNSTHYYSVLGKPADWQTFWGANQHETWYLEHPLKHLLDSEASQCVPVLLHGDDAQRTKSNGSIGLFSWYSPCSRGSRTVNEKLVCTVTENSEDARQAVEELTNLAVSWSLKAACCDRYPKKNESGEDLDAKRKSVAGNPIVVVDGVEHYLVLAGITGDWKYYMEELEVPQHYNSFGVCCLCKANSGNGLLNYADFRVSAGWTRHPRSSAEYWHHLRTNDLERSLHSIPGLHPDNMFEDLLHDMLQGIGLEVAGSALLFMARRWVFGPLGPEGTWQTRLDVPLLERVQDVLQFKGVALQREPLEDSFAFAPHPH